MGGREDFLYNLRLRESEFTIFFPFKTIINVCQFSKEREDLFL